jgi:L-serine dehydratase
MHVPRLRAQTRLSALHTVNNVDMESISVFDIFKIGVGPSSSHTMGPWRAAQQFVTALRAVEGGQAFARVDRVKIDLYGSLAKTGHGHGTDVAVLLGLSGEDPVTCVVEGLVERVQAMKDARRLRLRCVTAHAGDGVSESPIRAVDFDPDHDLLFHMTEFLPFHPNGVRFTAFIGGREVARETYYSVGGGFVVQEGETPAGARAVTLAYPVEVAEHIKEHCRRASERRGVGFGIPEMVLANERSWRTHEEIRAGLLRIWRVMQECCWRGCHTPGVLPGGLSVVRRAAALNDRLLGEHARGTASLPVDEWLHRVRHSTTEFRTILKWVSTFALAVNEENAAFGRVVTAPTNGAAGVIPAVMMYAWCFLKTTEDDIINFMLVAAQVGILFKKGATISAAMGGCQAEIGVSSAMAAAGLSHVMGGSMDQSLMAAEIAMEHHLGMTCDPIAGLVQIPCIERNTMGAVKAITAANIAVENDPANAKVSLDGVIKTMWATALDMQSKYKETSEGGLAVNISVSVSEC